MICHEQGLYVKRCTSYHTDDYLLRACVVNRLHITQYKYRWHTHMHIHVQVV